MIRSDLADLSFEDAIEILRPALPDDSLVLVGGQAVAYWLEHYRDRAGVQIAVSVVASSDIDLLGSTGAVGKVAAAVRGTVGHEPRVPNLAVIRFQDRDGNERLIDFLHSIHGLEEKRVRDTAVSVEIQSSAGNVDLKIMHPVVCLESRVHNTHAFERYKTVRALRQLEAAIGCARAYILDRCDQNEIRQAHRAIHVIGELACSDAGRDVFRSHRLDPLDAIPEDDRLGSDLYRENLPRLRARRG